ncbi:MAG: aspartate ammonia-lyase [Negativicutes bacterium]|nr:aspartate ammonia-lyase [Negativicutes bacterium]
MTDRTLGKIYYGEQTRLAMVNFALPGERVHGRLIKALAMVKQAAAMANGELGRLPRLVADAIARAAAEVAAGGWDDQFPLSAWQGGAGTSLNMNMNEVLAARAGELAGNGLVIDPIEHVNCSQSTNDVCPTALRVAALWSLRELSQACASLQGELQGKEAEFAAVKKLGRTQLMDAVPITLGMEFSAWAEAVARDRWRLFKAEERLKEVSLGATAIGVDIAGQNRYASTAVSRLRALTGLALSREENFVDGTQNYDAVVEVSGLLKACAVNMLKMSADLRLLASGPRGGLAEISLPARQLGSTIMPGKVNPVMLEMLSQAAYQAVGCDTVVTLAAQAGQLELNPFWPLIAHNFLTAIGLLTAAIRLTAENCIAGIRADRENCHRHLAGSMAAAPAVAQLIGYHRTAGLVGQALAEGRQLAEVIAEDDDLPAELRRAAVARCREVDGSGGGIAEPGNRT